MALGLVAEQFLTYLRTQRGYAAHTLDTYARQLNLISQQLQAAGLNDWSLLQMTQVEQLVIEWRRAEVGSASIQQRLAALRSLCDYLLEQGRLTQNPARLVQAPKGGRRLPRNLDVDGMQHLLDSEPADALELRDRAMFELLYSCGLRVSELVSLNTDDIQPSRELRVVGKGRKTRIVPYGKVAATWLQRWLSVRQQCKGAEHCALFLSRQGNRLSIRSVQLRLKKWGVQRGVADNLHPHKLRHSFASHMLESSGDLRAVQELLGHANLSTTQVYTHLDFQHLASVYDAAHPRAKKKS